MTRWLFRFVSNNYFMEKEEKQKDILLEEKIMVLQQGSPVKSTFGKVIKTCLKLMCFTILSFCMCFHIMPDYDNIIFPKEHFSFANTVISRSDVRHLIDRHNNAAEMERMMIRQEYIHKRLIEFNIIVSTQEEDK